MLREAQSKSTMKPTYRVVRDGAEKMLLERMERQMEDLRCIGALHDEIPTTNSRVDNPKSSSPKHDSLCSDDAVANRPHGKQLHRRAEIKAPGGHKADRPDQLCNLLQTQYSKAFSCSGQVIADGDTPQMRRWKEEDIDDQPWNAIRNSRVDTEAQQNRR